MCGVAVIAWAGLTFAVVVGRQDQLKQQNYEADHILLMEWYMLEKEIYSVTRESEMAWDEITSNGAKALADFVKTGTVLDLAVALACYTCPMSALCPVLAPPRTPTPTPAPCLPCVCPMLAPPRIPTPTPNANRQRVAGLLDCCFAWFLSRFTWPVSLCVCERERERLLLHTVSLSRFLSLSLCVCGCVRTRA